MSSQPSKITEAVAVAVYCRISRASPRQFYTEHDAVRQHYFNIAEDTLAAIETNGAAVVSKDPAPKADAAAGQLRPVLTVRQTAEYLGVSVRKVRDLASTGVLKPIRLGKIIRFNRAYLEAFTASQNEPAAAPDALPDSARLYFPWDRRD